MPSEQALCHCNVSDFLLPVRVICWDPFQFQHLAFRYINCWLPSVWLYNYYEGNICMSVVPHSVNKDKYNKGTQFALSFLWWKFTSLQLVNSCTYSFAESCIGTTSFANELCSCIINKKYQHLKSVRCVLGVETVDC